MNWASVRTDASERRRDRGRRDVLTLRRLEHVLLAIGDAQEAVGIDLTDIAGVEPAVLLEGLGGGVGQVVVAVSSHRGS